MEKLDPSPLPQKSKIRKMRVFALRTASSLILGGLGLVVPFYSVQDCNLGQTKWKIQNRPPPPPPPKIKDGKMARFCPSRGFILDWGKGGWVFVVPFYSIQDCSPSYMCTGLSQAVRW